MAVKIDIFGSCVCRDIFRDVDDRKYKVCNRLGNVPITSLYEEPIPIKKDILDETALSAFEKQMLKIQLSRKATDLLKKSEASVLVLDLADELMERWTLEDGWYQVAVPERNRKKYHSLFSEKYELSGRIVSGGLAIEIAEDSIRQFAKDIIKTDGNPNGYRAGNIIVIESYYSENILSNDGSLHKHDERYHISEKNEFLRKIYEIFHKYFSECKIIKLPEQTYSSENHIRGVHPLHYTQETYDYFMRAIDVLCGFSKINTTENLYRDQSLKNSMLFQKSNGEILEEIHDLAARIDRLEKQTASIKVDIFGCCVSRDIFRYTFPGRYTVCSNIERLAITNLYCPPVNEKFDNSSGKVLNYEKNMFELQLHQNAVQKLKNSEADILILDLGEERLERYILDHSGQKIMLNHWGKVDELYRQLFEKDGGAYKLEKVLSPFDLDETLIREKFSRFAEDIVKSETNPDGYLPENIYVVEIQYAKNIISNSGKLANYKNDYKIGECNAFWQKLYKILYEYLPNCKRIKLPLFTYASENHKWGKSPLHYTDATYRYLADAIDSLTGVSDKNSVDNLNSEQSLDNRLFTRVLNGERIYEIDSIKKRLQALEKTVSQKN
ncbi:hypothetical protein B5F07_02565 [Lachnoclostridium sp. An169]|uniref:DUF6270 domain-containing protein n=1 Tax=Lachnoclostridium sp. An169 TaxID=1965569 RepID=UPI000B3730FD|nr:DUF6270 domain-containing protein [Lachnoclostridium sp. An169]OUP86193.1 hypothetical protein B5F07_02565 [Lachnoclostridium sp. An169]